MEYFFQARLKGGERPTYALPLCHHQPRTHPAHRLGSGPAPAEGSGVIYCCQQRPTSALPSAITSPFRTPCSGSAPAEGAAAGGCCQLRPKAQQGGLRHLLLSTAPTYSLPPCQHQPRMLTQPIAPAPLSAGRRLRSRVAPSNR